MEKALEFEHFPSFCSVLGLYLEVEVNFICSSVIEKRSPNKAELYLLINAAGKTEPFSTNFHFQFVVNILLLLTFSNQLYQLQRFQVTMFPSMEKKIQDS